MKSKQYKKIITLLQSAIFLLTLVGVSFFGFTMKIFAGSTGTINGCTYTIKSMEAQPQNVTPQSQVTLYADVIQSGTGVACQNYNQVYFVWWVPLSCQGGLLGASCNNALIATRPYNFSGQTEYNINIAGNLSIVSFDQLIDKTKVPYFMEVKIGNNVIASTVDWGKFLTFSGQTSSGGTGLLGINIKFDKAAVSPDGGDLTVSIVDTSNSIIQQLPTQVAMLTYVCPDNTLNNCVQVGNNYGSGGGIDRNLLANNTFQDVSPTDQNGFKNGSNIIRVDIQDAQAPYKLYARAVGTIQASGFSSTRAPTGGGVQVTVSGGTKDIAAACGGNSECKSNSCVSGVCAAAAAPGATPPNVNCSGPSPDPNYCLYNPLPTSSLLGTLLLIMKNFLVFLGAWSAAFIVIGGFKLIMSQGKEEAITSAKKTIGWAIAGFAIAVLSFSIMAIIQNILQTRIQDVSSKTSVIRINRNAG